jgi:hypothetical protein
LTSESFRSATFTLLVNDNLVLVETLPTDTESVVDLKFTWWFTLEVENYPSLRLNYAKG